MVGWIRFYSAKPPAFITAQRRNTMNFIVKKLELSRLLHVLIRVTVSTILSVFFNRNFSPKLEQMWVKIHLKQPVCYKSLTNIITESCIKYTFPWGGDKTQNFSIEIQSSEGEDCDPLNWCNTLPPHTHIFVSVPSQDLDFQQHISWCFLCSIFEHVHISSYRGGVILIDLN
jgi:hypothetical protein